MLNLHADICYNILYHFLYLLNISKLQNFFITGQLLVFHDFKFKVDLEVALKYLRKETREYEPQHTVWSWHRVSRCKPPYLVFIFHWIFYSRGNNMLFQTCPNWTSRHIVLGEQKKLPNFLTPGIIHSLMFFFVQQIFVVFQVHTLCQVLGIQYKFPW